MKPSRLIVFAGLAVGLIAYTCFYLRATYPQRSLEQSSHPELAWLKAEYHLTDAQFAAVVRLHDAYSPKCAEMCRRIDEQNAKVQRLLAATNTETAMLQHFYETSRQMSPEQGKRYLAWVQGETLLPGQMVPTRPPANNALLKRRDLDRCFCRSSNGTACKLRELLLHSRAGCQCSILENLFQGTRSDVLLMGGEPLGLPGTSQFREFLSNSRAGGEGAILLDAGQVAFRARFGVNLPSRLSGHP